MARLHRRSRASPIRAEAIARQDPAPRLAIVRQLQAPDSSSGVCRGGAPDAPPRRPPAPPVLVVPALVLPVVALVAVEPAVPVVAPELPVVPFDVPPLPLVAAPP